jgi:cation:H+ antiporter
MPSIYLVFIVSLVFLILSADLLLKFVEKFSSRIKISPLIVGATIIAVGTSLPETFVAISAIAQKAVDISFGDIIGSNIANICLILGIAIFFFPVRIGTEKTQKNNFLMAILTIFFASMFLLPQESRNIVGAILIIFYIAFIVIEIFWGEIGRLKEDKKALTKMEKYRGNPVLYLAGTVLSMAGLIISSKYLVGSAISISNIFGIREEIIGLSLIAIGTSLPELATTIASGMRKDWKLLYGDIQGSNIYNLSIIGALLFMFGGNGYQIDPFSIIFMIAVTFSIIILSHKYKGSHIPRVYGLIYLAVYVFYIFRIYQT